MMRDESPPGTPELGGDGCNEWSVVTSKRPCWKHVRLVGGLHPSIEIIKCLDVTPRSQNMHPR